MSETLNSIAELETLKGSLTYKLSNQSNGRYTVTVKVDNDLHIGYGFSLDAAKNDAAANALLSLKTDQEKNESRSAFYTLKKKRKGLIFQSIRKNKGLFDVNVQVDFVNYYGKGETQTEANDDCAKKVLAAFDSGNHKISTQALYENAFSTLKEMYNNLLYRTISSSDDKYEVHVNVDGIDYFGEGQTIHEANNDTAWSALKGIWTGDHKKQLDENDEYWYDDDDYNTSFISSENLSCGCCCHFCNCC